MIAAPQHVDTHPLGLGGGAPAMHTRWEGRLLERVSLSLFSLAPIGRGARQGHQIREEAARFVM
jgi:hypothetical protein